ncbi:unnamed protein product [Rotaria sp. Silwood2]|nr:unnamed protein product [Rotaria sp. Silwood2]CAF3043727.1 unnamed protein product [Rotaria sp. Silwood2]CAF3215892.1 unnamed protein product [Rotaria sp. Silwood2]CAF4225924.1 unnamed protein product [Rotaria sp. Silwood2]CAF4307140.1 unnamed protein product [Rotaria sp. Silwood2]
MGYEDLIDDLFDRINKNQDGNIDKKEFRDWFSNSNSQFDRYQHNFSSHDALQSTADKYSSYGYRAAADRWTFDMAIHTISLEETNEHLRRSNSDLFIDSNPRIIRRGATEGPVTLEQRVVVRYLQPPPVPEPGPLIIKEVRPSQPPPPPTFVIREHPRPLPSPPPLILRERPPTPPPYIPSETKIRILPPIPVPPRSVVIERFPPPPEKPRDIIIERWIPYGRQPERRTIVEHASPAIDYPRPTHIVLVYDSVPTRIYRRFEKRGVTQENPDAYVARYGSSLLDPATLVQEARRAGVIEDITPPVSSSSIYKTKYGTVVDYDQSDEIIQQNFSSSRVITDVKRDGLTYQEEYQLHT